MTKEVTLRQHSNKLGWCRLTMLDPMVKRYRLASSGHDDDYYSDLTLANNIFEEFLVGSLECEFIVSVATVEGELHVMCREKGLVPALKLDLPELLEDETYGSW